MGLVFGAKEDGRFEDIVLRIEWKKEGEIKF